MGESVGYLRSVPRLFVAVWPPDEVAQAVAESLRPGPDADGVRWAVPSRYHMTLRFLGEADETEVEAALAAQNLPRVGVTLGSTVERLGRNALVVPAQGLGGLAAAVAAATSRIGRPPPERPYVGHLTVARIVHSGLPIGDRPQVRARFTATEAVLARVEPTGAYTAVGRFELV